jgi:hypothetical protein
MRKCLFVALLLTIATSAVADSADLAVSSEMVEISYRRGITEGISAMGSWLHHEDGVELPAVGIYGGGRSGAAGAFVGAKAFWVDGDGPDGPGIALGGAVSYELVPRITVEANIHYAPPATSYKDLESYEEWGVRVTAQILPVANIFAGFRDINVEIPVDGGHFDEIDLVRGGYAGITLYF